MTALDVSALRRHIGTRIVDEDVATEAPLKAMVATFDREEDAPREGEAIPEGWHIGYFLSTARTATLSADGLPAGTGVLPKLPLPRRMYAGTRITFHAPLQSRRSPPPRDRADRPAGARGRNRNADRHHPDAAHLDIARPCHHRGLRHRIPRGGEARAKSGIPKRDEVPANLPWRRTITAGPVALFRFSALTGNPHRIHYDRPYAMEVEGYPGLVVHGPFTQACLTNFVRDQNPGRSIRTFSMRARAPLFDTAPFDLVGRLTEGGAACEAWAVTPSGTIAMQASAKLG